MRPLVFLILIVTLSGCSALMLGGGSSGSGSPYGKDERSSSQVAVDGELAAGVQQQLSADSRVAMFDIDVRVDGGAVTLSGSVDTYAARERAEKIAIGVDGVAAVNNRITVQDRN